MFEECRLEGNFTLSSGRKSGVFYNFELLMPNETAQYVEKMLKEVPDELWEQVDFIASPAVGGIVPGFLVAFAKSKPFVVIDKEGGPRGPQFNTGRYLIVDDVVTSFKAANFVRSNLPGLEVLGVLAYMFRGAYADLDKQDYPAFYLTRKEQEV